MRHTMRIWMQKFVLFCVVAVCVLVLGSVTPGDADASKMYWASYHNFDPEIQRADLDGGNVEEIIPDPPGHYHLASGIALDLAGGTLYWTDYAGPVRRADLDGGNVEELTTTGFPVGIALDLASGKMYVTQDSPSKIWRADLDGGNIEDLIAPGSPEGIALDLASGKMYWTESEASLIRRADLDGGNVEDLVTTGFPVGIALDLAGGKMYWTESDLQGTPQIRRADLDGGNSEFLLVTGSFALGIALDLTSGKMYWTELEANKIRRADLNGENVEDLVNVSRVGLWGIALDLSPSVPALSRWGTLLLLVALVGTTAASIHLHSASAQISSRLLG